MVDIPDVGHKVQIEVDGHNGKSTHEGVILHPAANGHVTIKLANGYNASYGVNEIVSIKVIGMLDQPDSTTSSQLAFKDNSVSYTHLTLPTTDRV